MGYHSADSHTRFSNLLDYGIHDSMNSQDTDSRPSRVRLSCCLIGLVDIKLRGDCDIISWHLHSTCSDCHSRFIDPPHYWENPE